MRRAKISFKDFVWPELSAGSMPSLLSAEVASDGEQPVARKRILPCVLDLADDRKAAVRIE